jgi:hypothetical protein
MKVETLDDKSSFSSGSNHNEYATVPISLRLLARLEYKAMENNERNVKNMTEKRRMGSGFLFLAPRLDDDAMRLRSRGGIWEIELCDVCGNAKRKSEECKIYAKICTRAH